MEISVSDTRFRTCSTLHFKNCVFRVLVGFRAAEQITEPFCTVNMHNANVWASLSVTVTQPGSGKHLDYT